MQYAQISTCVIMLLVVLDITLIGHNAEELNYAQEFSYPEYTFSYGVQDPHTGDVKHQWEKRKGDYVQGRYSLVEPDGSTRVVHYTADDKHGFNAVVKNSGTTHHSAVNTPSSHSEVYFHTSESGHYAYQTNGDVPKSVIRTESHPSPLTDHAELTQELPERVYKYESTNVDKEENKSSELHHDQDTYYYLDNTELESNHNFSSVATKHPSPQKQEFRTKSKHILPADLRLLSKNNQKQIPLEAAILKPTEVDLASSQADDPYSYKQRKEPYLNLLTHKDIQFLVPKEEPEIDLSLLKNHGLVDYNSANQFIESSHHIGQDELNYYINQNKNFYGQENSYLEPIYQNNFQPTVIPKKTNEIPQSNRPGLIKTNKKPHTTPGLRNFSTSRGYLKYVFPPSQPKHGKNQRRPYSSYYNPKGPILFPPNPDDRKIEIPRLYQTLENNAHLRYGKNVNYHK